MRTSNKVFGKVSGKVPGHTTSTVWKKIEAANFRFFCVGCNRERTLLPPAKVGSPRFFGHILLTTAFCTVLAWPWLGFKGAAFFVIPVGLVFEAVFRLKMRASLRCPDCGFDRIFYLVDKRRPFTRWKWPGAGNSKKREFPIPSKNPRGNSQLAQMNA